jgi:hypothetical protein
MARLYYCRGEDGGLLCLCSHARRVNLSGTARFYPASARRPLKPLHVFFYLRKFSNGRIIASAQIAAWSPPPMWISEHETYIHWNWVAIFSHAAAMVVSLAIWREVFKAVQLLVK